MPFKNIIRNTFTNRKLLHRRLQRRLLMYPIIAVILFGVVIYDAIMSNVSPLWILVGTLIGLGIGYLVGQIFKVYWKEDVGKVVMGIDRMSIVLIVVYIVFRIASEQLLKEFVHGNELTIVTFSFLAGLLLGRMLGVLRKVSKVLHLHAH